MGSKRVVLMVFMTLVGCVLVALLFWAVFCLVSGIKSQYNYDLPALLFGAAALSLFILSILIALAAVLGWNGLQVRMDEKIKKEGDLIRHEIQGTLKASTGIFFGVASFEYAGDEIKILRQDFLDMAIAQCDSSLELLVKDSAIRWKVMNNLAFLLAIDNKLANGRRAQELAQELRAKLPRDPNTVNTCAKVVATFHRFFPSPRVAILEAREILEELLGSRKISESEKENARRHLVALDRALKEVEKG
jgi:succinate dehydrogenase hydrophobic anchor subunit